MNLTCDSWRKNTAIICDFFFIISLSRFFLLRNRNLSHEIFSYHELNYFFLKLISAFFAQHLIAFFFYIYFLHNSHTRIISFVITNVSDDEVAEQINLSFRSTTRYGLLSLSAVSRMKILFRMNMCALAMFHYRCSLFVQSIHF